MSWSDTSRGGVFTTWLGEPRATGADNLVSAIVGILDADFP